ncbi:LysR family transcriptional regulator [Zavarzinia sp. CC-PAN008]|uniref:LysR family transcriptional regulator n=1 Tax=Zavarzinia sp. CC-PAN008 TaxID=3243332 RepID=UPI003F7439E7
MEPGDGLRGINLNLLPMLSALLRHRNVTRASVELNLTQAAVSNGLRRLRAHFGDALLVREGRRMRLTERAIALQPALEASLTSVRQVIGRGAFDPATTTRRFRIATADYVAAIVGPPLAARLGRAAPSASVQFSVARRESSELLRAGRIDLIVGPRPVLATVVDDSASFATAPILTEPFVVIVRRDDPAAATGLDEQGYFARAHATFNLDLSLPASLEVLYLRERGLQQVDRVVVSEFVNLPLIVAQSDCIALIPQSLARLYALRFDLAVLPSPIAVPDMVLTMMWHRRVDGDPGHAWLRDQFAACAAMAAPG